MYDKKETLEVLKNPYPHTKKRKYTPVMRVLQGTINRINKASCRSEDFIQNKYHFSEKVKHVVKVPELYAYTTYPEKVGNWLEEHTEIQSFVVKPNHLSRGIAVRVLERQGDKFLDTNGDILTTQDIVDECAAVVKLKKCKGIPSIIIQERIHSHPDFGTRGMADIRTIYFDGRFLFSCIRIPTARSGWYGNIHSDASYGFSMTGEYISGDIKFLPSTITEGTVPFFDDMVLAGQRVCELFGLRFQAIDMTVDESGEVVVIESERSPQLHYYLSDTGTRWLLTEIRARPQSQTPLRNKNKKKRFGIPELYFRG